MYVSGMRAHCIQLVITRRRLDLTSCSLPEISHGDRVTDLPAGSAFSHLERTVSLSLFTDAHKVFGFSLHFRTADFLFLSRVVIVLLSY